MVIGWVETKDDRGAGRFFNSQALRADWHTGIRADFESCAHAPDVIPPGAWGSRAQGGTFFLPGLIPCAQRSLAQFAVNFLGVAMGSERIDVGIGRFDFPDVFAGKEGGQASLPELVFAFDLAFGLGRWGVAQADVVEFESPAQLGKRVGVVGEKDAVIIDVELQGPSVGAESGGQEIEIGKQQFAFVNFGTGEQAAAIIDHVEHGKGLLGVGKPAVGRGIQLPEFADAVPLPAAHGGANFYGRNLVGQAVGQCPPSNLGAVEFETMQAQRLGGGEAVGTRRSTMEPFAQKVQNGLRPGCGVIAARVAGCPDRCGFPGASPEESSGESIKPAAGNAELISGLNGFEPGLSKGFEHIPDEGRRVTANELLVVFRAWRIVG